MSHSVDDAISAETTSKDLASEPSFTRRDSLFLHSIVENIPHMIFVKEAEELRFVLFNRAGEDLLGMSRDQLIGRNDYDLFPMEQAAFFTEKDRQVLAGEGVLEIPEEPIDTAEHGTRYLFTRKIPLRDADGEPRFLLGISLDITERKEAEVELRQAKEAAEAASRTKSRFLANMSHEMRTPLNGVMGASELLGMTTLTTQQREFVTMIQASTGHLTALIHDILDLSKIEAGTFDIAATPFSLRAVLHSVRQILDYECEKKKLRLSCIIDDHVPDRLRGDPDRLRQVLLNLANNAVKFTERGDIVITVSNTAHSDTSVVLRFTVKDTGIGLSASDQERIFESFTQVDSSASRRHSGAGLGLAISKQLCHFMGGDIGVRSTLGEGSTFWFTITIDILTESQTSETSADNPPATRGRIANGNRVLLVEDNVINQKIVMLMLQRLGYEATVAIDGNVALSLLEANTYDIVLMDCQLPDMDGFEVTRHLRENEPTGAHIPVIAMTAMSMLGDRERCIAAGMDDYITKPMSMASLRAALERWSIKD